MQHVFDLVTSILGPAGNPSNYVSSSKHLVARHCIYYARMPPVASYNFTCHRKTVGGSGCLLAPSNDCILKSKFKGVTNEGSNVCQRRSLIAENRFISLTTSCEVKPPESYVTIDDVLAVLFYWISDEFEPYSERWLRVLCR